MQIEKSDSVHAFARGIIVSGGFFNPPHATQEQARLEAEPNEILEFGCPGWSTYKWTLERKPSGSTATLSEPRLKTDLPGVYVVRVEASGRWFRELAICCFSNMYGTRKRNAEQRLQVRAFLNAPGRTLDDVISRLEK